MTCSECQDLLLDLAYGELPPERATEVEAHAASCGACQLERALLESTRGNVAPLREVEEPPEGFDAPIMAAARAEASLLSDGLPGAVIDAVASSRPLGVAPARIDTGATVVPLAPPRKNRRALLLAFAGSLAAAAVIALVVSNGNSGRRTEPASEAEYQIHVRTPADLEKEAAQRAQQQSEQRQSNQQPARTIPQPPPPPEEEKGAVHELSRRAPAAPPPEQKPTEQRSRAKTNRVAKEEHAGDQLLAERYQGSGGDGFEKPSPAPASRSRDALVLAKEAPPSPAPRSLAEAPTPSAAVSAAPPAPPPPVPVAAEFVEQEAAAARLAGDYPRAAELFRRAAQTRIDSKSKNQNTTAWDLAHAVQCLASAGSFDEGRKVRSYLARLFPGEEGPIAAASRALQHAP